MRRSFTVRASGPETALICGPIGRSGNAALKAGMRPMARPQAVHAAGIGRIADRAGDIGAVGDVADAGRDRRARAAGRAARGDAGIARVLGVAVDEVGGEPAIGHRRTIGAAEQHRAGLAQIGDHRIVDLGDQRRAAPSARWWWRSPPGRH